MVFRGSRQVSGNQTIRFGNSPKDWGFLTPQQERATSPRSGTLFIFPKDRDSGHQGRSRSGKRAQGRPLRCTRKCPFPSWEPEGGGRGELGGSPYLRSPLPCLAQVGGELGDLQGDPDLLVGNVCPGGSLHTVYFEFSERLNAVAMGDLLCSLAYCGVHVNRLTDTPA